MIAWGLLLLLGLSTAPLAQCQENMADLGMVISNSSSLLQGSAQFFCEVIGNQGVGETLNFIKIDSITGDQDVLSVDSVAVDTIKYSVTDRYRLTVRDIAWSDEGEYRCSLGITDIHVAYMVVSDPPTSSEIYWGDGRDYTEKNAQANLTCEASSSRPPATFRWFRGQTEVTGIAIDPKVAVDINGYGRGISMLELTPTSQEEGMLYSCIADVPGKDNVVTQTLAVSFSGASHVISSVCLILTALLATAAKA
jgi:hypothetical protein